MAQKMMGGGGGAGMGGMMEMAQKMMGGGGMPPGIISQAWVECPNKHLKEVTKKEAAAELPFTTQIRVNTLNTHT